MNIEYIKEVYGEKVSEKISEYIKDAPYINTVLIYQDENVVEILGGIMTNHSMSVDDALKLLDIDMDKWSEEQGWDGWDWGALELV